ncbi:AAA-domain-containing protein [Panus rudis PR-1116 ss-1]|nr:AAA-domain-containing protein [Panus rudis PR-1116 ss-1]
MTTDEHDGQRPDLLNPAASAANSLWKFPEPPAQPQVTPLRVRIPPMAPNTRRKTRSTIESPSSGSEYHESTHSMDADYNEQPEPEPARVPQPEPETLLTSRGRVIKKQSYVESSDPDGPDDEDELNIIDQKSDPPPNGNDADADEDDEDGAEVRPRTRQRNRVLSQPPGPNLSDDDAGGSTARYNTRSRDRRPPPTSNGSTNGKTARRSKKSKPARASQSRMSTRRTRQSTREQRDEDNYVDHSSSGSGSAEGSMDEMPETSSEPEVIPDDDKDAAGELDDEAEQDGRPYSFRQRAPINYAIPPPLEEMPQPPKPRATGRANGRAGGFRRNKPPGWSASGAELSKWISAPGDDSDSDYGTRTPRKPFGVGAGGGGIFAGSAGGTGGLFPPDLGATAGTPSNLGKVGDASLADADPLGVNQNVSFDEVGGLDEHINSLKEMTLLPLLYPEVFQRFNVTPPRGVLFHGPPGTGKTLLARALAASCRSNGKGISFFMRKGADCLSKWVGEAERQLRLLFEEARNQQPSIIFFDEIDGLAPVRSSKQDQIHASIVSTLLALMDGMDGRGQVVVIGATNRPDAIDPALRRPGRFDREFYFPLPGVEARERILRIMTRKWAGWEDEKGEENCKGLAQLTKGYGGADLRALCTEAALNAVQRRYPQIYRSNDRLLLKPETIQVELRDFMVSIKKLVPSSARAAAPEAAPLPTQLTPLLGEALKKVTDVIETVLPPSKKRTALEEAEYEDPGDEGALEREMMLQSMETLRVYRPRVVVYGPEGMGQRYIAAAALHHLEGYHVQSLDLASLMSDSTRTLEAAIIQLFVEAKRHQPSVVYIPSLNGWCSAVSETARTTVRAMLDSLGPSDPVLLLAVVDGPFSSLPKDVKAWFGPTRQNRAELTRPTAAQREEFFKGLYDDIRRPPNQFPDGVKRKKRMLEELPIAPPLEPRQPTAAELAVQEANDQKTMTLLKYRLGPILTELKRKFRKFTKRASEEYNISFDPPPPPPPPPAAPEVQTITTTTTVEVETVPNGDVMEVVTQERTEELVEQTVAETNGTVEGQVQAQAQLQIPGPQLYDMDLEIMHSDLYRSKYLTPDDFLDDLRKIVHNADVRAHEDPERLLRAQAMYTAAEVSIQDMDATFRMECQRMAVRERKRREDFRKEREKEKASKAAEQAANAANGASQSAGTRRSARANGLAPEHEITDPLQIERRMKRQRSQEASAERSEEEGSAGREAKRSRMSSREPVAGPSTQPSTPHRSQQGVRFADADGDVHMPSSPTPNSNGPLPPLDLITPSRAPFGFDSILNPKQSPEEPRSAENAFNYLTTIAATQRMSTPTIEGQQAPSLDGVVPPEQNILQQFDPNQENGVDTSVPAPDGSASGTDAPAPAPAPAPDAPMEIERTPTPPPPPFELDEDLLSEFSNELRESTGTLNVEQLEQLRATCLNRIWHHRTEWNRTPLIHELKSLVKEFIHDVALDDSGEED